MGKKKKEIKNVIHSCAINQEGHSAAFFWSDNTKGQEDEALWPWFVNTEKEKGLQRHGWGMLWSPDRSKSISEYMQFRDRQRRTQAAACQEVVKVLKSSWSIKVIISWSERLF